MERTSISSLGPISQTLLINVCIRVLESRRPDPLLRDEQAIRIVDRLGLDPQAWVKTREPDLTFAVMRMVQFDSQARSFLESDPDGAVVDIGCGLDGRLERIDNGRVQWFGLDLPEVIAARRELLPEAPRACLIAGSSLDFGWMEALAAWRERPVLFLAEGVLPYFTEGQVRSLVLALKDCFPGAELVFDTTSPFLIKLHNQNPDLKKTGARLHWGPRRSAELERWGPGLRLLGEWGYFDRPESRLGSYSLMRFLPLLKNASKVLHYRLGERQIKPFT